MTENIILCGFMGCGKTTVGRVLASLLGMEFADLDSVIESRADMTVSEIFTSFGEEYFRALEAQAAAELSKRSGIVLATGGGAVLDAGNVALFKSGGRIVFIDVPLETISGRLEGDASRPLLPTDRAALRRLYDARQPLYRAAADIVVSNAADAPAPDVAREIVKKLGA
ncbi:MAG: shikimate kinase [Clostridia bacterium]|nr:shikimate kinase [Clostridia bacterium]